MKKASQNSYFRVSWASLNELEFYSVSAAQRRIPFDLTSVYEYFKLIELRKKKQTIKSGKREKWKAKQ
jgi:hypothetical protein